MNLMVISGRSRNSKREFLVTGVRANFKSHTQFLVACLYVYPHVTTTCSKLHPGFSHCLNSDQTRKTKLLTSKDRTHNNYVYTDTRLLQRITCLMQPKVISMVTSETPLDLATGDVAHLENTLLNLCWGKL